MFEENNALLLIDIQKLIDQGFSTRDYKEWLAEILATKSSGKSLAQNRVQQSGFQDFLWERL